MRKLDSTVAVALNRRQWMAGALATLAAARLGKGEGTAPTPSWLLLGTQDGEGVYRARWNAVTGEVGQPELAVATPRPSFIAMSPRLPVLYACNEHEGDAAGVSAFGLERARAELTPLGRQQPTHGDDPCYVSTDRTGRLLLTANYGGGSLSVFPLNNVGMPGAMEEQFACAQTPVCGAPGPVHDRQDAPHLHCATVSPDNRSVVACDLADDALLIFPLDAASAAQGKADSKPTEPLGTAVRIAARPGSGPRHVAFHPDGHLFYCIHELDCTVDAYTWNGVAAETRPVPNSVLRLALPSADATKPNTAAELVVSGDGRFLYTCTRGTNELTVAALSEAGRRLTKLQQLPCNGAKPRFIALDPTERWLLCANQDGNSVTVFARNERTGRLTPQGQQAAPSPMCIVWV